MTLKGDFKQAVIWQETNGGVPEAAIIIREYADGIISLNQQGRAILVNRDILADFIKVLRHFA